jgi:hypothetical protein
VGDKSEELSAGRIIRTENKSPRPRPDLPPDLLAQAQSLFRDCAAVMQANCLHVDEADCAARDES